jgi:hypothetical protein
MSRRVVEREVRFRYLLGGTDAPGLSAFLARGPPDSPVAYAEAGTFEPCRGAWLPRKLSEFVVREQARRAGGRHDADVPRRPAAGAPVDQGDLDSDSAAGAEEAPAGHPRGASALTRSRTSSRAACARSR